MDELRHHQVLVKVTGRAIVAEHRRPVHGSGVYYHVGLTDAAIAWCREREIPAPRVHDDPVNAGFVLTFDDKDHAFEFKIRWF